eukprot:383291-Pyramimonas_sp.AAC.1
MGDLSPSSSPKQPFELQPVRDVILASSSNTRFFTPPYNGPLLLCGGCCVERRNARHLTENSAGSTLGRTPNTPRGPTLDPHLRRLFATQ